MLVVFNWEVLASRVLALCLCYRLRVSRVGSREPNRIVMFLIALFLALLETAEPRIPHASKLFGLAKLGSIEIEVFLH